MTTFVAFLRGINVGGNKTIRMEALKGLFDALSFTGVRTHLNSGNVVFVSDEKDRPRLSKLIGDAIEKEFGFRPAVILRSVFDLQKIVKKNPFADAAKADPSHLLVMLLVAMPHKHAAARLAEVYGGPEEIRIAGDTVYLTYPNGIGKSKLTNTLLEKHLRVVGTARNWNTVVKLLEITAGLEAS